MPLHGPIGPARPPARDASDSDGDDIGPQLPAPFIDIGPQPPRTAPSIDIGPQLPRAIGPQMPPRDGAPPADAEVGPQPPKGASIGPQLPPEIMARLRAAADTAPAGDACADNDSDSDDGMVGPRMPVLGASSASSEDVAAEFERRAEKMRRRLNGEDEEKAPVRESWMLELPPERTLSGVVARTFSQRDTSRGDTAAWTDTPADKERKRKEREEGRVAGPPPENEAKRRKAEMDEAVAAERDRKIREQLDTYNREHRSVSLMEMHQQQRKAAQPTGAGADVAPYRPFNRETDLEGRKYDPAKRKALLDRAKDFGSKFAQGRTGFL